MLAHATQAPGQSTRVAWPSRSLGRDREAPTLNAFRNSQLNLVVAFERAIEANATFRRRLSSISTTNVLSEHLDLV